MKTVTLAELKGRVQTFRKLAKIAREMEYPKEEETFCEKLVAAQEKVTEIECRVLR